MEQNDLNKKILQNKDDVSHIKGKLDELATKDFVRKTVQDTVDKQTATLEKKIDGLSDEVTKGRDWRNRIVGGGTALVLLITLLANLSSISSG